MILSLFKFLIMIADSANGALASSTDEELMRAYQKGDVEAFEILVKRHEKPLFNFIFRSVNRTDLAEELLQETFIRIIKSASSYQEKAKFTTWAYTIARNICIDRARKNKYRKEISINKPVGKEDDGASLQERLPDSQAAASSADYDRKVFLKRLEEALETLPEDQREVFVMREVSGLKFREIAEVLECPLPTVKSRMRYAIEALRAAMSTYAQHSFDAHDREEVKSI